VAARGRPSSSARWRGLSRSPSRPRVGAQRPQLGPRLPARRQDERESARGRRAVLGGHPQREVDQIRGHVVLADGRGRDEPLRIELGVLGEPDHHPIERLAAEGHLHDRADAHRLGRQRVVERPGQAPGGGEGFHAGDHGVHDR
jgi:hypothetical protein